MAQPTVFLALLCGLLATLTSVTSTLPEDRPAVAANSTLDYLERVLTGLDRAMTFFHRELRNVNLDAAIGTRILESTLTVLLRKIQDAYLSHDIPVYIISHIEALHQSSKNFSDQALPYIRQQDPAYYQNIGPIINEGLFELDYGSRAISQSVPMWPFNPKEAMREEDSDDCLAEIFGTWTQETCSISSHCWSSMTALGYSSYSLSHQIFYLQIAERFGCQVEMRSQMVLHRQVSLNLLHETFCANMMAEAQRTADQGFPEELQDLFMEQGALCGMLGFRDFFTSEWAHHILSWQDPFDGCYKWAGWPVQKRLDFPSQRETVHRRRTKREEKRVSHGCLCHRTTVAVAALSQYVRYILEVWLQENNLL